MEYSLSSPVMAASCQKDRESSNCSVPGAGCLHSSSLVRESWGIPGKLLIFSLLWNPREVGYDTDKGMLQQQRR